MIKSDEGKEVFEHTPSSSRTKLLERHIPRWFWKEIIRSAKHQFHALEDDICDIAKILNKPKSPLNDATPFTFITTIWNQDLFAQVAHPLEGTYVEVVSLEDYEVKDIMLENSTQDIAQQMMTMGVKDILKNMEQDEIEIKTL